MSEPQQIQEPVPFDPVKSGQAVRIYPEKQVEPKDYGDELLLIGIAIAIACFLWVKCIRPFLIIPKISFRNLLTMKALATLLNIWIAIFFVGIILQHKPNGIGEVLGMLFVFSFLGINVFALRAGPGKSGVEKRFSELWSNSWLGLFLKRKRLEERQRINAIETQS